jgi:hypothetical protein
LTTAPPVRAPIRSTAFAILILATISVLSFPSVVGARPTAPLTVRAAVLTPDGTDSYVFDARRDSVRVSANATNTSGNLRTVFWSSDASVQRDATTCATWNTESSDKLQQGAALRISEDANGAVRAITVTKNVFPYGSWIFNVHVWSGTGPMQRLISVDLGATLSRASSPPVPKPLPWRVCARTEGSTFRFKAWPLVDAEPRWGDPRSGGSVVLPENAPTEGYPGWYAGHLSEGMTATFTDLRTEPVVPLLSTDASGSLAR